MVVAAAHLTLAGVLAGRVEAPRSLPIRLLAALVEWAVLLEASVLVVPVVPLQEVQLLVLLVVLVRRRMALERLLMALAVPVVLLHSAVVGTLYIPLPVAMGKRIRVPVALVAEVRLEACFSPLAVVVRARMWKPRSRRLLQRTPTQSARQGPQEPGRMPVALAARG